MTSLSTRLTLLYAATFLVASAGMLAIGYYQINARLMAGVDRLIATERQRIFTHLDLMKSSPLDAGALSAMLRRPTDNASTLFRVEVRRPDGGSLFRSSNLAGSLEMARRSDTFLTSDTSGDERLRVGQFAHRGVIVLIATPLTYVSAGMWAYIETSGILLLAMIILGIGLGYALSQMALRPLRDIAATASRVGSDNLQERIVVRRHEDEVGVLAHLLNAMLDRIESSFRQIRQFTADASHELKTPLSLVRLHAEALLDGPPLDEAQENHVVAQLEQVDQLAAMVEDLLVLARADSSSMVLTLQPLDPGVFLEALRADAEVLAEASGCAIAVENDAHGPVEFDARWLRRIVFNLLTNALRVSESGQTIRVNSTRQGGSWRVTVEDRGPGLAPELRERMFDRFFTSADGGTGLGLAICRSIVALHGGTISAGPGCGDRGLAVTFSIPATAARDT